MTRKAFELYPALYQINTRIWLTRLASELRRTVTLEDIPDAELDQIAENGFDWVWLLSVWQTGADAQRVSREHPIWRHEFQETLSDLREDDIEGSGFAIISYSVHQKLGGASALSQLRKRLHERGVRLMLDFVPNHMGIGHPWINEHPEYFVQGSTGDLAQAPQNYIQLKSFDEAKVFAFGRDPNFQGWPDTLQLNYANPAVKEVMIAELLKIAEQCDGVRCDMAMLILPEIFERTWNTRSIPFWEEAIQRVRDRAPQFKFVAEVYWDLEWTMQKQGFDYTYDKRLYDRLRHGVAKPIREHLEAELVFQDKLARFLENHDEPRAAATFTPEVHKAAAVITFFTPGLRFFHQGQLEGKRIRISPHLVRGPEEPIDHQLKEFYKRLFMLLHMPIFRNGQWQLLNCYPAWEGNWTSDCYLVFVWYDSPDDLIVITVNYAANQSQCLVRLPFPHLEGKNWKLQDQLGQGRYEWQGHDLTDRGLYLDQAPWQACIFTVVGDRSEC